MRQLTTYPYFQMRQSGKIQIAKMWATFFSFEAEEESSRKIYFEILLPLIDLCLYLYDIAFYTKDGMV